jgi:Anti-sigma factor NepR
MIMQARQGTILNHGKPIPPDMAAPVRKTAPDQKADRDSSNRTMRNAALQQGLRAAYRTVVEEPLPDRLLALLQQLDGDGPKG